MRRVWLGMLLVSLPLAVFAQSGSILRESVPPYPPPAGLPPPPPDDGITAAPLPPPDQEMQPDDTTEAPQQDTVPNPLQDPNSAPPPGADKQTQQQGQPQRGGWVQMGTATLQALDKVNARGNTLVVKVGDTGHFESLDIAVRGCFVRSADRPSDATAFLVIRDKRADEASFSGWMVRSAPYMSMLAHPIYDVRVAGCTP
jgi:hypothetical protein